MPGPPSKMNGDGTNRSTKTDRFESANRGEVLAMRATGAGPQEEGFEIPGQPGSLLSNLLHLAINRCQAIIEHPGMSLIRRP
jgi:hypothetical protein